MPGARSGIVAERHFVKKYAAEIRRKAREVAERAEQTLAKAGASRETAEAIKRDILGIA